MMSRRETIPCFSHAMKCSPDGCAVADDGAAGGTGDGGEAAAIAGIGASDGVASAACEVASSSCYVPDELTIPTIASMSSNRSEETTSELQSLMRISYAVFRS